MILHSSWFLVENFLVDEHVRYLLTPYPVVIWASFGIWKKKNNDSGVPKEVKDFVLTILIIASITFAVRIGLVIYMEFFS